ncbi:MAG: hypothetical protein ACMUEM_05460 [Flavobacteriales bacterium AspAUS03]
MIDVALQTVVVISGLPFSIYADIMCMSLYKTLREDYEKGLAVELEFIEYYRKML